MTIPREAAILRGMNTRPKLRWPLEMRFEKVGDQEVLLLQCPMGITPQPLLLLPGAAPILSCFDGRATVEEISTKFAEYGVTANLINELIALLDESCFLDTANFHNAERRYREQYRAQPVRPAALAGSAYPAAPDELTREVTGYLKFGANGAIEGSRLTGLIAPHIDYRRGGLCYGMAYGRLATQRHDLYIVIGICHAYSPHMFHLSRKDFAGPLGTHPCDHEFVNHVARRYGEERSFADEILHRNEHSIELQMPFLGHLQPGTRIVPILVGGFHRILDNRCEPSEFPQYDEFAAGLAETLREAIAHGRRVCVITGVDMAHVGRAFGDSGSLSAERMQEVAARDRLYLEALVMRDKRRLFAHVAEDHDARRICGFPAVYTTMDVLDRAGISYRAELLDYRQAVDYQTDCAVTFAGVALYQ